MRPGLPQCAVVFRQHHERWFFGSVLDHLGCSNWRNGSKNIVKAIGKWVLFLFAAKENVCTSSDYFPKFFLVTKCLVFKCISDLFSEIDIFSRCILLFVQKCFILSKCDQIGSQCSETNEREFLSEDELKVSCLGQPLLLR